jgi:hypothetical protein
MNYTIYSSITGQILRNVQTIDINIQLQPDEAYVEGFVDGALYYIENSQPVAIPAQPSQYAVFDYTTKQWVLSPNLAIAEVSQKRSTLLYASDWTQIPNNPLTTAQQQAWATYRQELRDIPQQSGYPYNVVWPTPPQG